MNAKLYIYAGSILDRDGDPDASAGAVAARARGAPSLVLDWRDPAVKQVFALMIPVTLGLGLINVNAVIDLVFASRLIDRLAPTAIQKAFLVYMLPQGVFSVAISTVLFRRSRASRPGADLVVRQNDLERSPPARVPAHPRRDRESNTLFCSLLLGSR